MRYKWLWTSSGGVVLALLALAVAAVPAFAQTGSIEGTVRNAQTAGPVGGARVIVVGTDLAATTNPDGYYRINDVPAGTHEVRAAIIGYTAVTVGNVSVGVGLPLTLNIQLQPAVIRLDEVVVTGVLGETQRAKLPFTVEQISGDDIPVPVTDAASAISGKVAGVTVVSGSGRPGAAPTILLRAPTMIDASGRNQEPLYVVDGVILGSGLVDLDALDIENIEIVKGAAAASLYGSRAAAGVVQIQTRRGSGLPQEEIRFTVRSEFGVAGLENTFDFPQHHFYEMTSDGSQFVDASGNPCDWLECPSVNIAGTDIWDTFMVYEWPGATYDQAGRFFDPGNFFQNYLAAEGRSGGTNFHASWSNMQEQGVMPGKEGFTRNNFRVNVDQRLGSSFKIGASAFYSRSTQDDFGESGGNILFDLTRIPAGADIQKLNECSDPTGATCANWEIPRLLPDGTQDPNDVWVVPDPQNDESPNPLYESLNIDDVTTRGRFLGSANVRWSPLHWLSLDGNVSYDRLDYNNQYYRFKGYKSQPASPDTQGGGMSRYNSLTEAFNASANLTLNYRFNELATRAQFRYLVEYDDFEDTWAGSDRFTVGEVPTLQNLDRTQIYAFESETEPVRADGYFGIVNLEYKDRYILDALVRNDGSSLFGPDERRHWYWRLAGAWRVTEDVRINGFDELKLRAAYGTAGGRPGFSAQYETYSVTSGGVSPAVLGNRSLKPELSKELELGVDMLLFGRAGLTVNYASTNTEDQILLVPLQGYAGFTDQWQNAGTLKSTTWEAMLDFQRCGRPEHG
jgi:TonB-linked SusC/RagA family outer membrane protein